MYKIILLYHKVKELLLTKILIKLMKTIPVANVINLRRLDIGEHPKCGDWVFDSRDEDTPQLRPPHFIFKRSQPTRLMYNSKYPLTKKHHAYFRLNWWFEVDKTPPTTTTPSTYELAT